MRKFLQTFMNLINGETESDEDDDGYGHYLDDLHDKFAMAALTGFLSAPGSRGDEARRDPKIAVKWAYLVADEAMDQRIKDPEDGSQKA